MSAGLSINLFWHTLIYMYFVQLLLTPVQQANMNVYIYIQSKKGASIK